MPIKKIIKSLPANAELVYHDIRQDPLTEKIVAEMKVYIWSYSKRVEYVPAYEILILSTE